MTIQTALQQGIRLLEDGAVPAARLTAEVLLCHALHQERSYLYGHPEAELAEVQWIHYGRYLHERLQGKPTQYITRTQEFYGRPFLVTPAVLIPRPETEHLVEIAKGLEARRIVDIGCGSGAIAVTLQLETGAEVWATDISPAALEVARRNADRHGVGRRVSFRTGDLLRGLDSIDRPFDAILANPPYVVDRARPALQPEVRDFEPAVALFGGSDGLELITRLVAEAPRNLRPGGYLIFEFGLGQDVEIEELLQLAPELALVGVRRDLQGISRTAIARRV